MDKSPDAFRTISEVAEWLGVQAHVLRFWESKFTQVKPVKRAGGRRYYRPSDMLLLGGIKRLLHDDGLTIKGVQKTLREQSVAHVSSLSQELCDVAAAALDATGDNSGDDTIVVPFKSVAAQPAPEPDPEILPQVAAPSDPEVTAPEKPEPEAAEQPATTPEPPAATEEKPILPSFLHRPVRKSQPQTPVAESPPETVAAQIRPIVVEAPDPPDENDLPYVRGPLTQLANLDRLTPIQIAEIAPLAEKLQAWLAQSRGAGAS